MREDLAVIQTIDFFPPIVDDPYTFGQIAAANALSDIYAMGGSPALAMNLLCFPGCLPLATVGEILAGGADKVREAGATIAGGHSIEDEEPKYGLAVTGFAHPDQILSNASARVGDLLILTKPIGTGVLALAAKGGLLDAANEKRMLSIMTTLNRAARDVMVRFHPHACTDITGFGLLGHSCEMATGSGVTIELLASQLPVLPAALEYAAEGLVPASAYRNRGYLADEVLLDGSLPLPLSDLLFDPQTSGGLLIAVPGDEADGLLTQLLDAGVEAAMIGSILPRGEHPIVVRA